MGSGTWWAVSIQRIDGHIIDGVFMTHDERELRTFAQAVHPLRIRLSAYTSHADCARVVDFLTERLALIDPKSYLINLCD